MSRGAHSTIATVTTASVTVNLAIRPELSIIRVDCLAVENAIHPTRRVFDLYRRFNILINLICVRRVVLSYSVLTKCSKSLQNSVIVL